MVTKYKQVDLRKIKIINNGKNINQTYKREQRRLKIKRIKNRIFKIGILAGIIIILAQIISYANPRIETVIETKTITIDNLQDKIIELQNEVVGTIMKCESKGHNEEDGLIVFDSNKKASIGQFQFQVGTIQYYSKKLYNKELTQKEAILLALNTKEAEKLTFDIVFKGGNKADDWYNCSKKHNLDEKLQIINKLNK